MRPKPRTAIALAIARMDAAAWLSGGVGIQVESTHRIAPGCKEDMNGNTACYTRARPDKDKRYRVTSDRMECSDDPYGRWRITR